MYYKNNICTAEESIINQFLKIKKNKKVIFKLNYLIFNKLYNYFLIVNIYISL